jgi:hypothetical protein
MSRWRLRACPSSLIDAIWPLFGFLVGLNFTARGGEVADVAYHATMLPVLVVGLVLLVRTGEGEVAEEHGTQ